MKSLLYVLLLNGLVISPVLAKKVGRGNLTPASARTNVPAPGGVLRTSDIPEVSNPSGEVERCDDNTKMGNYVSLGFLHTIVDYPQDIRVVMRGNLAELILPRYVSACTKLDFEIVSRGSYSFIKAKNEYAFTPDNTDLNEDQLKVSSMDEKYYSCMKKKGLLTSEDDINREKAESVPGSYSGGATKSFNIDLGDRSESKYIAFGSPNNTQYGSVYPNREVNDNPNLRPSEWRCMAYENLSENGTRLFTSEEDSAMQRAYRACQSNDYEEIYSELVKLKKSSVGNAKELIAVLEKALDSARTQEMNEIMKKMGEIEETLKRDSDGNFPSEDYVKEQADKYLELTKRLNYVALQPSIQKINELLQIRNEENKKEVDRKIKELNKLIGSFYEKTEKNPRFLVMLEALKAYALTDQAYGVEGVRLTSKYYSQVYKEKQDTRGANISLKQADEYVVRDIKKFEKDVLSDWNNDYLSKNGSKAPIASTERDLKRKAEQLERSKQSFLKKESEFEKKLCGRNYAGQISNPSACQSFLKGRSRRLAAFQKKRNRSIAEMRNMGERRERYANNYTSYLEKREMEDDGDGYSGGIEEFYYGAYANDNSSSTAGGFDMNMFNMGQSPYTMNNPFGTQMQGMQSMGGMQMMQGPGMMGSQMGNPYSTNPMMMNPNMGYQMMPQQQMMRPF